MANSSTSESLLLIGHVWRAHGVRGEIKIIPETDDPQRFEDLTVVYVGSTAATANPRDIESVRYQPTKRGTIVIVKLRGTESRDEAEAMRKAAVFAHEKDLPPLEAGEFFLHDLIGLVAVTSDLETVGTVTEVVEGPAQPILVVAREGRNAVMIPAVDEFIDDIDLDEGRIIIRPIEGLLD